MGGGWVGVRVGDRYRGHPRTVVGNPGHISTLSLCEWLIILRAWL